MCVASTCVCVKGRQKTLGHKENEKFNNYLRHARPKPAHCQHCAHGLIWKSVRSVATGRPFLGKMSISEVIQHTITRYIN